MNDTQTNQTCALISAKALGKMLSLSARTIWRLRSSGKLPEPVKVGGAIRWVESEIVDFIKAGAPDRKTWEAMQQAKGE